VALRGFQDVLAKARRRKGDSREVSLAARFAGGGDLPALAVFFSLRLRAFARTNTSFRQTIARRRSAQKSWLFLAVFRKNFLLAVMLDFPQKFSVPAQMLVTRLAVIE
jgi:hypothetical protein